MSLTVQAGELVVQDPGDIRVYVFSWEQNLASGVEITGSATWTLSTIKPLSATALTKDQESLVSGNRKAQVRIQGGQAGAKYNIACKITTNEAPTQTKEQSFFILVQDR